MVIIFALIIFSVLLLWFGGFIYANDFSVANITLTSPRLRGVEKVLVVFPHADDEALSMGGFLSQLSHQNIEVDWLLLTKGEKGNDDAHFDEDLKAIRSNESQQTAKIYGVKNLIQKDFPDDGASEFKKEIKTEIEKTIQELKPELIITFDQAGMYGHPDHIVVSESVTETIKENYPNTKLWYVSFPKKVLEMQTLPEYMAKDPKFKDRRVYPTHKIWVGLSGILTKIKAVYTYKSQMLSYKKSFPIKQIPLWFYVSLTSYEYFHEVQ